MAGGAFAFFVVYVVGLVVTGVSWLALLHDLRLRSVWAVLLEVALFASAAGMIVFSASDAVKNHFVYSACVFALLFCLTFWPFLRHCIRHRRWPD
ncbi:hypothetical protein [Methylobacterium soli]|uniref:Uncharacterized protein n=1 Tax=Methylobacterium soli TaxID=553447 RepID=A0A6L3T240_9HYPH|nr:hypothetical protein [Methylobacterium soli]KAB1077137.1 hypothetical protein F6X53_19825 [Methylobacterium soli]